MRRKTRCRIDVQQISPEMAKVLTYVPLYAVIAHRGSTFWAPEKPRAAYGAGRATSALTISKATCSRRKTASCWPTTMTIWPEPPTSRRCSAVCAFHPQGLLPLLQKSRRLAAFLRRRTSNCSIRRMLNSFRPYYAMSYYFHELLMLDARAHGSTRHRPNRHVRLRRAASVCVGSPRPDRAYAEGKKLNRDANGGARDLLQDQGQVQGHDLSQIREAMPQSNTWLSWSMTSPTPTYPTRRRQRQPPPESIPSSRSHG